MQSRLGRSQVLEAVFWTAIVLIFLPRIALEGYEWALRRSLDTKGWAQGWQLNDRDGHNLGLLSIPQDLRFSDLRGGRTRWTYSKTFEATELTRFQRPGLVLGRIGDADRVYLNDCLVGSTGLNDDDSQHGWWWSVLRSYEIPQKCLQSNGKHAATFKIELIKFGGPSFGIYGGPIGVGDFDRISNIAKVIDWLRYVTLAIFGITMFLNAFYYIFVYVLVPSRSYYGVFALSALSVGVYELMTSTYPFRVATDGSTMMRILFSSAVLTAFFVLLFLHSRFRTFKPWLLYTAGVGGAIALAVGLPQPTLKGVYATYEIWQGFFLLTYVVAYAQFLSFARRVRTRDLWRYVFGFTVLMSCVIHDVLMTVYGSASPYLITYGFMMLFGAVALALAKESADAFDHVEEQVGERTRDLGAALNQLRALEKMKERFFANISHDFKTPVTVALGSIEEAKQVKAPGEGSRIASMLQPAERSLHHLLEMISELLDTVKAESGTLKMNWETAKPAELLREWVQPYEVLCDRKGIQLDLDVSGCGELRVPLDVSKLRRVVDNLLSNAVKFTDRRSEPARRNHPTGIVQVALRTDDARFWIEISDSGMGIPEDEKGKIFDRYYQSSRTSLKDHGGSGIGLAFAKEMVDLHNGRLSVETSEWGGAKFIVAVPLSQDVEVTGEHQAVPVLTDDVLKGSLDVAYPPETPRKIDPTLPSVLAAEDNPEVAQIVIAALSSEYNVFFAPDGEKALSMIRARAFDCLVTDIVMPRMRGDELVSTIRADSKLSGLPIVVVSSHSEETLIATVLRSGANDYVTKPFRREILLARVRAQIEAKKTTEWLAQNEKVIELGFLANGMAHQINNGLASLTNQTAFQLDLTQQSLENVGDLSPETKEELAGKLKKSREAIERALKRIRDLTQSVQAYSSGSRERTLIHAADSVDLALTLHADKIKKKAIQVRTDGLAGLHFTGYSNFHEVMVNLIGNAADAVKDDGSGVIEVTGRGLEKERAVEIAVVDNGMGIAAEYLPKLCRPFFTTKAPGDGTGMGLYVVRSILEGQHKGTLTISSEGEGKGARFAVRVPQEAPEAAFSTEITIHGVPVG
jgi:signal transduction histidine kinase